MNLTNMPKYHRSKHINTVGDLSLSVFRLVRSNICFYSALPFKLINHHIAPLTLGMTKIVGTTFCGIQFSIGGTSE